MVFNRLCAPDSKLGCQRWLDTLAMPAIPEAVEGALAHQIRPLVDRDLAIVF